MLRAGIAGASEARRHLLFQAVALGARAKSEPDGGSVAVVQAHDPMLDRLSATLSSAKSRGLPLELRLPPPSGAGLSARAANRLRGGDLVLAALGPDPVADLEATRQEAAFQDLAVAEPALERVRAERGKGVAGRREEEAALSSLLPSLEGGAPPGPGNWGPLRDYGFLLLKPWLAVADAEEEALGPLSVPALACDLEAEAEIASLDAGERGEFLADLGVEEPAAHRVVRAAYAAAGMVVFYTGNHKEARAWSVPAGTTAQGAGAAIHEDIGRGFIRAEVMKAEDLVRLGTEQAVKDAGLWRLQGKEYEVEPGDYLAIRHT